ncbi:MAG: VOC family protein [Rhodospirillales bacterium]|nr:VOC family protein [Rhodospirillales bacterium]
MQLHDIHHVAIKTQDLVATDNFYDTVLGMEKVFRPEFTFPGSWFNIGRTMVHIMGGHAGLDNDGNTPHGGASVDHIALEANGFDEFKKNFEDHDIPWRQFAIPEVGLWQLFAKDPNGVLIELNFTVAKEPEGSTGPGSDQKYLPGEF